ncbi:hypothetical protein GCM10022225_08090 [Plantactinospora mayteni]|uniref:NB-ARC domain-containing protein n=1 Tax=Plantactinospora mayteni TaxID=566021 RepID=A0ABQ4EIK1_9ACTN|nr:tetratricopeptide repeat protein [Plantactinospora mayteni]GIG94445.1 hypothetical protein Pma05_10180 [Plantactinospora mayteni]
MPASLPGDIADFTGRVAHIDYLRRLLTTAEDDGEAATAPVIAALSGMGGVGKTALAVRVAHLVADEFPDGQLYVNLRGAEAVPLDTGLVLARFLRALGVDGRAVPHDPDERAEVYRDRLAGRRVLVVLDNTRSEEQIRPLLPGTGNCAVLVTSRARLTGIEGARFIDLDMFSASEATHLLCQIAGPDRVAAQAADAREIVDLCAGLPLAVRIAAARLAARRSWPLATVAIMLREQSRRLDRLATGDLAVRASLELSYRGLDVPLRRLFRRLGLFDMPDFPYWLPALVLGCPPEEAIEYAEALVDAQLLAVAVPDVAGQLRYRFHDLVRLYARERAVIEEPEEDRRRVLELGLGGWLAFAERLATGIPGPSFAEIRGSAIRPAIDWADGVLRLVDPVRWFDAERVALLAAVRQACQLDLDPLAFDLAGCLEKYFDLRGLYAEWASTNDAVLATCQRAGNRLGEAVMLRGLIDVLTWALGARDGVAMARLRSEAFRLLDMFTELQHEAGSSDAAVMCSWAMIAAGDYRSAVSLAIRALRLAESSGHLGGRVRACLGLAVANFEQARYEPAVQYAAAALEHARALGNPRSEATALQFLGIGYQGLGDLETSERMLDDSLAITRRYRDHYTEVLTILGLARVYLRRGNSRARAVAESAMLLSREYNMSHHLAEALEILGEIELAEGHVRRAIGLLEESVALWRTRGWHSYQAKALTTLGRAYAGVDPEAAHTAFDEARRLFARMGDAERAADLARLVEPGTISANARSEAG